jgi:hypothetical protein
VAVSGATGAVAAGMLTGAQIKDGTVTTRDVKNHNVRLKDFSSGAVAGLQGAPGPAGPTGATGAPGLVRAYGLVSRFGVVSKESGGITVTKQGSGAYCLHVPDVDSQSTMAVVSPDFSNDSTSTGLDAPRGSVEFASASSCPAASDFRVLTFVTTYDATTHAPLTTLGDQGFSFVIP